MHYAICGYFSISTLRFTVGLEVGAVVVVGAVAVGAVTVSAVTVRSVVVTDAPTECVVGEEEAEQGGGCGTSALVVVGIVVVIVVVTVVGETRLTCWTDSGIPPTAATADVADVSTVVCIDGSAECKVVVVAVAVV